VRCDAHLLRHRQQVEGLRLVVAIGGHGAYRRYRGVCGAAARLHRLGVRLCLRDGRRHDGFYRLPRAAAGVPPVHERRQQGDWLPDPRHDHNGDLARTLCAVSDLSCG